MKAQVDTRGKNMIVLNLKKTASRLNNSYARHLAAN